MTLQDHTEREGYVANLETGNFENDLQATNCSNWYLKNGFQIGVGRRLTLL
jgi:hypothetical protein